MKKLTSKTIKNIANYLEELTPFGQSIKIIEIFRKLTNLGYNTANIKKTHDLIVKTLRSMGWKLSQSSVL
ncbi:MAG: hypothetical protein WC389_10390 [Lutibacter sp.]|jgi:hypothetical protein